jgi:hypothetical protein
MSLPARDPPACGATPSQRRAAGNTFAPLTTYVWCERLPNVIGAAACSVAILPREMAHGACQRGSAGTGSNNTCRSIPHSHCRRRSHTSRPCTARQHSPRWTFAERICDQYHHGNVLARTACRWVAQSHLGSGQLRKRCKSGHCAVTCIGTSRLGRSRSHCPPKTAQRRTRSPCTLRCPAARFFRPRMTCKPAHRVHPGTCLYRRSGTMFGQCPVALSPAGSACSRPRRGQRCIFPPGNQCTGRMRPSATGTFRRGI